LYLANAIKSLPEEQFEEVCLNFLDVLKAFPNLYDDSDYVLRDSLFSLYLKWGQYVNAAQILSAINLSSTSRPFTDDEKVDIYIKCAECFLEEEAAVDAEVFVNKASQIVNNINEWSLLLRYRVTFARVLDANRKFIEAALRYYDLSTIENQKIVSEELLELLAKAVTCTILGKSGQQRNRIMGLLFNDPRLASLDQLTNYTSHSILLTKMFKGYIIRKEELGNFEASLQEHQKAVSVLSFLEV
jgi:COP9 signalosome complex subunit 4